MMIGYASSTGTKRNLAALRAAGWRLMVSAKGRPQHQGFAYALDNGAWWAFQNGQPFDEQAFLRAYDRFAEGADFVVLPDVVAGGEASLAFSLEWRHRLGRPPCPLMLAVQDGMPTYEIAPHIGPDCGIFVGGSTEWKISSMPSWGILAEVYRAKMHVGRVNTARRIAMCHAAGADSFDGSSASRFAKTLPLLDNALRQPDLLR